MDAAFDDQNAAPSIRVAVDVDDRGDPDNPQATPKIEVGRDERETGPIAFKRQVSNACTLALFKMSDMALTLTRSSTDRVEMPWT